MERIGAVILALLSALSQLLATPVFLLIYLFKCRRLGRPFHLVLVIALVSAPIVGGLIICWILANGY